MALCQSISSLPLWVTIGFLGCTGLMLIITSWFSFKDVSSSKSQRSPPTKSKETQSKETKTEDAGIEMKEDVADEESIALSKWEKASCCKKCGLWFKDIWKRKSVYVPLITHLSDTATDFAAVVEFYEIASTYSEDECGIDVWYLFGLSIGAMILYRIISSIAIYRITKSFTRVLTQFIDIEIFQILWLSHRLGLKSKSSPQRLISVMEAVFEAAPQSMIQIIFLLKTQRFSGIIAASSILSFLNLTTSIIGDDKQFLQATFEFPWEDMEEFRKWICIYIFRICDVPSAILIYAFTWNYVGGLTLTILVAVDAAVAVICFLITKCTDALLSAIAVPFSFGNDDYKIVLRVFYAYSVIRYSFINIFIWVHIANDDIVNFDTPSFALWVCASCASIIKYFIGGYMLRGLDIWEDFVDASKERSDLSRLLLDAYWDDAIELIFYKQFDIDKNANTLYRYGNVPSQSYSLLKIAVECTQNKHLFEVILKRTGLDNKIADVNYETALMGLMIGGRDLERLQLILDLADFEYVMHISGTQKETALYRGIRLGASEDMMKLFLQNVDRMIKTRPNYESEKNRFLNNMNAEEEDTVFSVLFACIVSIFGARLSMFRLLYDFYPDSYKVEALTRTNDGKTLLEVCKEKEDEREPVFKKIGLFIKEEMNKFGINMDSIKDTKSQRPNETQDGV